MNSAERSVNDLMRRQQALVTAGQAAQRGMLRGQVQARVSRGDWIRFHRGVYGSAAAPVTPDRLLLAACLAAGQPAAASHLSAAWLLGLVSAPPPKPVLTVPYRRTVSLEGVLIHRSRDLDPQRLFERRGIPYTDPLRVLTDVAAEMEPERLVEIADRALATRLVTTEGLRQEAGRRRARGRSGPTQLLDMLRRRGITGGPEPSVLEAETLRLFARWGVPLIGREVRILDHERYRIDFLVARTLCVEVDGYAYHWSPEAKAYDDARRNRLRTAGLTVLVYDWKAIRFEGARVVKEIRAALRHAA